MIFRPRHTWLAVGAVLLVIAGVYVWKAYPAGYLNGGSHPSETPLADDKIILLEPLPGATVTSPLTVRGKARGSWFFEASFPVVLTDWDGHVLGQGIAQAQGDWMTTEFVDFEAVITFTKPASQTRGLLILKKDNPSGLPQYDDSRAITVYFK